MKGRCFRSVLGGRRRRGWRRGRRGGYRVDVVVVVRVRNDVMVNNSVEILSRFQILDAPILLFVFFHNW